MQLGDYIKVYYADEVLEGTFVKQDKFLFLKLDNGYNVGLDARKIKKTELLRKKGSEKKENREIKQNKSLPRIAILHTGGTIASKVDYSSGAVIALFSPEEIQELFPEISAMANLDSRLISNIMSENMRFHHYNLMAEEIEKEIQKGVKGIIITHGTDTLHLTSAALSFMLENLPVPIILVGSQRSSDRGSSDASMNLLSAISFITNANFKGVALCMHENMQDETCLILPGLKSKKMHSSRRDAFRPINAKPIARIDYRKKKIDFIDYIPLKVEGKLKIRKFNEQLRVGILRSHINMHAAEVLAYEGFDGLVLEGTGLGHYPVMSTDTGTKEHDRIAEAIAELAKKMPVVLTTDTVYGRVNMEVYTVGRKLLELGVIGTGLDMTTETAFIKLAWLLSNYSKEDAKKLFCQNLRGEISTRTEKDEFLI